MARRKHRCYVVDLERPNTIARIHGDPKAWDDPKFREAINELAKAAIEMHEKGELPQRNKENVRHTSRSNQKPDQQLQGEGHA